MLKLSPWRKARTLLWGRYAAASIIAGVLSQLAFMVGYAAGATPLQASVIAFVVGAVPNYLMNRYWAWRQRGHADFMREVLPYAVIVIATAAAAAGLTTLADAAVHERIESHAWQVILVSAAFLGTYGFMFVLKFVLFDRLIFDRTRAAKSPA